MGTEENKCDYDIFILPRQVCIDKLAPRIYNVPFGTVSGEPRARPGGDSSLPVPGVLKSAWAVAEQRS